MTEPSFQTEEEEKDESFYPNDSVAAAVRIEKRSNWLDQIEYTDRAVKRLRAIDTRERLRNERVHWAGRIPEIKYSTEDLERDLFGGGSKVRSFIERPNISPRDGSGLTICKQTH